MRMLSPRDQRGNALVEFALVAPLLVFLLAGIVILALMVNAKIVVSGAAREAGRHYAIHENEATARDKARDAIRGGGLREHYRGRELFNKSRDVGFSLQEGGRFVLVTVTYRQPTFIPGLGRLLNPRAGDLGDRGDSEVQTLVSQAVFRVESFDVEEEE